MDITVSERERIFFKVSGTNTVFLTGNYVIPVDEGRGALNDSEDEDEDEDDEEGDYDLPPDDDEMDLLVDETEESDDLDGLQDPRVTEVESEEEEAPKLIKTNGQKKRAAESDEGESLDDIMAKDSGKSKPVTNGETTPLSKKQQKKQKKNNGDAAAVEPPKENKETSKPDKKVQFAKNLEQGPTPSPSKDSKPAEKPAGNLGVKEVKGVRIDDKKLGKGPAAKSGYTVAMRYIGKLEDGKVFDGMFSSISRASNLLLCLTYCLRI